MKWFLKCMRNYANFRGRARRKEYWMFVLFSLICIYAVFLSGMALSGDFCVYQRIVINAGNSALLRNIFEIYTHYWYFPAAGLVFFLPAMAATVRRLHDTGRTGWLLGWYWLIYAFMMALVFGSIFLLRSSSGILIWLVCGFGMYLRGLVFVIAFLVWLCLPGDRGANRYGPDPKAAEE